VEDLPRIAELAAPFGAVTVESHANTVGPLTLEFAALLSGKLEVAVGLETVILSRPRISTRSSSLRFRCAAARSFLAAHAVLELSGKQRREFERERTDGVRVRFHRHGAERRRELAMRGRSSTGTARRSKKLLALYSFRRWGNV